ncbi:hypothetical protein GZH53_05480 [Flavihumibacter sp. R14]|nr:hypothetical protein [Flavihumibacter soli]
MVRCLGINHGLKPAVKDDQLLIILWNDAIKTSQYSLQAYRSAGQFSWEPAFDFAGSHVWVAFVRQDRSLQSDSQYLGVV